MLLIVIDLIILAFAVILVKPLWTLISIIGSGLLKDWHNQLQTRQRMGQYYSLKKKKSCQKYFSK